MTPLLFVLLSISQTISAPTTPPTNSPLSCIISNGSTTSCSSFCAAAIEEIIYIGVEHPICPAYLDFEHTSDASFEDVSFSTTMDQSEHGKCMKEETGCGIPWLCQLLNEDPTQSSSCSTADFLFHICYLECDIDAIKKQYTNFKLSYTCCNEPDCHSSSPTCSHNAIYEAYWNSLYRCLYSQNAIDNKYEKVRKCNDSFDENNYTDVCDFFISETYTFYGCRCKASYLMAHNLKHEYAELERQVGEWNDNILLNRIEWLKKYGCAINVECIPNDKTDDILVGGLLNIRKVLYTVECEVYVPYRNVNSSAVKHIENMMGYDSHKIYVTFSDYIGDDPTSKGMVLHIFVVYFTPQQRDLKYEEWTHKSDWFGEGSEIKTVERENVNETLSYYGADEYYKRKPRNKTESLIAATVLAVVVGLLLIVIFICHYKRNDFVEIVES